MNNQKRSFFANWITLAALAAIFLFTHLFFVSEIKNYSKQKVEKRLELKNQKDFLNDALVEQQQFLSEERIVQFAKDSLGLVKNSKPAENILISRKQVIQINKLVNKKYE